MVALKEMKKPHKPKGIDDPDYFEDWWKRQPEVYKQGNHKSLAKFRWQKAREFLELSKKEFDTSSKEV